MLNNEQKENLKKECENINNKIYDKKFYDIVFKYHENFLNEAQVKDLINIDNITLEDNVLKAEIKPINTTLSLNVDKPVSIERCWRGCKLVSGKIEADDKASIFIITQ